jgi:hypothetical protein
VIGDLEDDVGVLDRAKAGVTFLSVVPCAGIRTRSDRFVTSILFLPVVHRRPESRKAVRSGGSQRGSQ